MDSFVVFLLVALCFCCLVLFVRTRALSSELKRERKLGVMKSAFIRNLGNEIRTPLLSMRRHARMIADEAVFLSKDEKKGISGQLKFNVDLISTLLDEMSSFMGNTEERKVKYDNFSPNLICQQCILTNMNNTYLVPEVNLRFRREIEDSTFVRSDTRIVELILNKLIINACKFTKKGEIVIGCTTKDTPDFLNIYVEDTGGGIPADRIGCLFDWFDNPHDGADVEFDLSIAQMMAVKIGGLLSLDEKYSPGTRMVLSLPMRQ